jgi:hypothetical protein
MGALLLNYVNLSLRVYDPVSGEVRQYANGKLEIDESDPCYAVVIAEARANPDTKVVINNVVVSEPIMFACDVCRPAQSFDSEKELHEHTNLVHMARPFINDEGEAADADEPVRRKRKGEVSAEIPPATAGRSG